jgi:hypothetical protein
MKKTLLVLLGLLLFFVASCSKNNKIIEYDNSTVTLKKYRENQYVISQDEAKTIFDLINSSKYEESPPFGGWQYVIKFNDVSIYTGGTDLVGVNDKSYKIENMSNILDKIDEIYNKYNK